MAYSETKLSPAVIAELSRKNSLGSGLRALGEWLLNTHGIKLSHTTINKKIMAYREDNYELSKELRAEKKEQLGIAIDADLALIQYEIDVLSKMAKECDKKKDKSGRLSVTDRLIKLIDLHRKFTGVKSPEEEAKKETVVSDSLFSKLDDLIERRKDKSKNSTDK